MADTITNNSVVQITLTDAGGNKKSFNIDNPKSNITMDGIKSALSPAITSGYWYNDATSQPFTAVTSATITETKKTKLENSDTTIEVTPSTFTISNNSAVGQQSFTVEGAEVISGYFSNMEMGSNEFTHYNVEKTQTGLDVKYNLDHNAYQITGTFNIVTALRTVAIPVVTA